MRAATALRGPARSLTVPLLDGYRTARRQAVNEHAARALLCPVEWSSPCKGKLEARAELEARPSTRASTACGGHIYFPSLTERTTGKRLCLAMGPDDLTQFIGLKAGKAGQPVSLTHGTLRHHPLEQRKASCTGHTSGVTQHDCAFLNKLIIAEATALTEDTQLALQADCLNPEGPWARAQFLEVDWNEDYWPIDLGGHSGTPPDEKIKDLQFDASRMLMPNSAMCVIVDRSTKLPVIAWGRAVAQTVGCRFRTHLQPLSMMPARRRFRSGHRQTSGFEQECAGIEQRLEMVGARVQGCNKHQRGRPLHERPSLRPHVVNADKEGDICVYVNAWDEFDYWFAPIMMEAYREWGQLLHALFPLCSAYACAVKA
uniref:Uncharacterized protein n=1 Tax=Haptolina brevifila TaxID=156173 RepID=A0A7S2JGD5_9EUKA|mmetsp:Transcript_81841/g.162938  ORF Transcript_81841/g.162938 Transcript_81841/m.162938 type:complete len:372 (+) Transcript_81841:543-1658(+)